MKKTNRKKTAAKKTAKKTTRKKATAKKAPQKTTARKSTTAKKAPSRKKTVSKKTSSKTARKTGTRRTASKKKATSKTMTTRKTTQKKTSARRAGDHRKTPATQSRRPRRVHATIAGIPAYKPARGEEYMSEGQREHFARLLDAWKRQLMEEVDRTVHHMQDEASNFPDPNDRASQESEFSLELRTRDRERKLLRKIEQTEKELEDGEYGWCEECGAEIGIRRLEARPTATQCIDCKTLDELRERQTGN
jgi:DnaK suppressor protein